MASVFSPDLGQKSGWPVQAAGRTWGTKRRSPSGQSGGGWRVCRGTLSPTPPRTCPRGIQPRLHRCWDGRAQWLRLAWASLDTGFRSGHCVFQARDRGTRRPWPL